MSKPFFRNRKTELPLNSVEEKKPTTIPSPSIKNKFFFYRDNNSSNQNTETQAFFKVRKKDKTKDKVISFYKKIQITIKELTKKKNPKIKKEVINKDNNIISDKQKELAIINELASIYSDLYGIKQSEVLNPKSYD